MSEAKLKEVLNFNEDDLGANRLGQLTQKQKALLGEKFKSNKMLYTGVGVILFLMIWVRATWPRLRYDRLMALGWKIFLPLTLALCFITAVGILLADMYNNQLYYWSIPILSIICLFIASAVIYRDLTTPKRKKSYASV